ncbi:MAG: hypothetical protein GY797_15100 [Deltaproteobacteria bacterium]|nr:hypothetical protein [Deltaproteobacteria bacterium]
MVIGCIRFWFIIILGFLFRCRKSGNENRLLAVGGTHVFDSDKPCRLINTVPDDAVKGLDWSNMLAVEARHGGTAEVVCGSEEYKLEIVIPDRLDIELADGGGQIKVAVHESFKVQARLFDSQGRELEIGKFTTLDWKSSEIFKVANDRSSGEFGLCGTCFGMCGFRAVKAGEGVIEARLGDLRGVLRVVVQGS